ncbi:MAG: Hpt domain-containing protein [Stellaceae bacterium]
MRVDFVRRAQEHGELLKSCASVLTRDRPARLDPTLLLRVEESAHKLHGSGATFGFAALSEAAGALEDLVSEGNAGSRAIEDAQASAAVLQAIERVLARIPRSTDLPKP